MKKFYFSFQIDSNEKFLDTKIAAKKTFIFSHNPYKKEFLYESSDELTNFGKEVEYINENNYKISTSVNEKGYYYAEVID